jgi:hypothetical protein
MRNSKKTENQARRHEHINRVKTGDSMEDVREKFKKMEKKN